MNLILNCHLTKAETHHIGIMAMMTYLESIRYCELTKLFNFLKNL